MASSEEGVEVMEILGVRLLGAIGSKIKVDLRAGGHGTREEEWEEEVVVEEWAEVIWVEWVAWEDGSLEITTQ